MSSCFQQGEQTITQKEKEEKEKQPLTSPFQYEKYLKVSHYFRRFGLNDSCRTLQCKHEDACLFNLINQTFKGAVLGYLCKTCVYLINPILNPKQTFHNPSKLLHAFFNLESLRFALFPAVYNFFMQGIMCFLRRKQVNPHIQSFLSGFIAGFFALATRQKKNRLIWAIFLISRGFDCFYRNIIRKRNLDYVIIFALMYSLVGFIYAYEPDVMPSGFNKFLRQFSNESITDLKLRQCLVTQNTIALVKKGIITQSPEKSMLLHMSKK